MDGLTKDAETLHGFTPTGRHVGSAALSARNCSVAAAHVTPGASRATTP